MRVSVSPGYSNLPVEYFIDPVRLSTEEDLNCRQVSYTTIVVNNSDENEVFPHWNGHHLLSNERPKWSDFHSEETIRLISARLEEEESSLTTTLLRQRSQILHIILRSLWTNQNEDYSDDGRKRNDFRNRMINMEGFSANGQVWQRSTIPLYGRVRENDWAIVLDGRTIDEIIESGIHNESIRCYSTGVRLVRINSIPGGQEIVNFTTCLNPYGEQFAPSSCIQYWLDQSVEIGNEGAHLEAYRPLMDIDGERAFMHRLRDNRHGGRPEKRGQCELTSGEELAIRVAQNKKVELGFKFIDIDDVERVHFLGFIVHDEERGVKEHRSIAPYHIRISFSNPNQELSRTKQIKLKQDLEYQIFRDLTKAFRILAKRQVSPGHQFVKLYQLGISKSHYRWVRKSHGTEVETDLISEVLNINGWD